MLFGPYQKEINIHTTREYMEANISKAMGGRVAEEVIFGHDKVTSGASSDIQMATKLAKDMVTKFGMSTRIRTTIITEIMKMKFFLEDK